MVRHRTVIPAEYGGSCAVNETDVEEVVECQTQPCSDDCTIGEWGQWTECTADCAGGKKTRERVVVGKADLGAEKCGNWTETIDCNMFACPSPQPTNGPHPTKGPTSAPLAPTEA